MLLEVILNWEQAAIDRARPRTAPCTLYWRREISTQPEDTKAFMTKVQAPRGVTQGIEEKYEEVRQLISIGRQRGYLVYDEVNDILPEEISTSVEEIEELYDRLGSHGIELVDSEDQWKERVAANEAKGALVAKEEGTKLALTPGTREKTNDPVRMYLREMGT